VSSTPRTDPVLAATFQRRLLIVEDEPLVAALLADALTAEGFTVASANDVVSAREGIRDFDPDGLIIDISLGPGPTGVDLAYAVRKERSDIAILFLTRHPDLRTAGVRADHVPPNCGFVRKDRVTDTAYLLEAIEKVLTDADRDVRHDDDPARPLGNLSEKQLTFLRLMALGYTNDAIAKETGLAVSSVERWVVGIFRDMGIESRGNVNPRVEAVRRYVTVAGIPERP
jgi:DNA-binding NarL/FixJ family response regulator